MLHLALPLRSSFFFNAPAPTEIYTLSLHDALPICNAILPKPAYSSSSRRVATRFSVPLGWCSRRRHREIGRSEEHTSELQSQFHLVCRLLLEKKKKTQDTILHHTTNQQYQPIQHIP